METPQNLTEIVKDYDDSQLLRERVEVIRQISRYTGYLAIIDEERRSRTPEDMEAEILEFPQGA